MSKISREQAEALVATFLHDLSKKGWLLSTRYAPTAYRLQPRPPKASN
jgi:hypothetical protein